MEHGDISNGATGRIVMVFEGLIGILDSKPAVAKEAAYRKARRWKASVGCYTINEHIARVMSDTFWRYDYNIDVVTWMPENFAEALAVRLDEVNLPVGKVWSDNPTNLARDLAYQPSVALVCDPDPAHQFYFGGKGRIVDPYTTTSLIGA